MIAIASILALLAVSVPASAEAASCGPKGLIEDTLGSRFGEAAFGMGMAVGNLVKFFSNPQSGSWTIVVVRPDGVACVVAQGENLVLEQPLTVVTPSRNASFSN